MLPRPVGPMAEEEEVDAEPELDEEEEDATLPRKVLSPSRPVAALNADEALGAELDEADEDAVEPAAELLDAVLEDELPAPEVDKSRPWSDRLPLRRGVTSDA